VQLKPVEGSPAQNRTQTNANKRWSVSKHTDVTELIIKAFYTVCHTLGYGFLEEAQLLN